MVVMMMVMMIVPTGFLRNAEHAFDATDNATDNAAHDSANHTADRTGSLLTHGCAMPASSDDSIVSMRGGDRRHKRGNNGGRDQLSLHGYSPLSDTVH